MTTEERVSTLEDRVYNLENKFVDKTNSSIVSMLNSIRTEVTTIESSIVALSNKINSAARNDELKTSEKLTRQMIVNQGKLINRMEEKLAMVSLPSDTKHYLEQQEISDFRSTFNKLKAMMVQIEQLYKNITAYTANITA